MTISSNVRIAAALFIAFASASLHAQTAPDATAPDAVVPMATPIADPAVVTPPDPVAVREPGTPDPAPAHPELAGVFAEFGGKPGMDALMEDFMVELMKDPRTRPSFEKVDRTRITRQLSEQFCAILGGGCTYSGRDMKAAHASLGLDKANFNALVEDLQVSMNRKKVPFRSQNKLLAILAPMHREVITR